MSSPTSVTVYQPESREFAFAVESVAAGTAGTVPIHEVASDVTIRYMEKTYKSQGFRKGAATQGKSYRLQRWVEMDITVCYHAAGFAAFALGGLMGNGAEGAVTGTTPKTHPYTPSGTNNRMNTFTIWFDVGDHSHVQKVLYGTLSGWSVAPNTDGDLEVTITLMGKWPTYTTTLTPTNWVGSTANYPITPILGTQGTYTLYNSAGSAITNNVWDSSLSFTRNVVPQPNAQGIDINDFNAGELVFGGSMHFTYDGLNAASVHDDYMNYTNNGDSSTHLHTIAFTNADGHGFAIDFYYLRWQQPTLDFSGEVVTIQAAFSTEHDESQLDQASPVLTAPKAVRILNQITAAMLT